MYNYKETVKADIENAIREAVEWDGEKYAGYSLNKLYDIFYNELWIDDGVTGNGSGSYFFSSWKAEEALCHNMDLLAEAYSEFGGEPDLENPEGCDVTIRCYLLGDILYPVLETLYSEGLFDEYVDEEEVTDETE